MNLNIHIRRETEKDHPEVFNVIEKAFRELEHTDHREQFLVERLRKSAAFIPELSLVAVHDNRIVGFILLTKIKISNEAAAFDSLAVAPVAVLPEYQHKGIGGLLLKEAHCRAAALGFGSAVLLGHAGYYPRFGYREAASFGIRFPFEVPSENCMAIELRDQGLQGVSGSVDYPAEFFG
jgi:predicted N-acetyltransferase YhbS